MKNIVSKQNKVSDSAINPMNKQHIRRPLESYRVKVKGCATLNFYVDVRAVNEDEAKEKALNLVEYEDWDTHMETEFCDPCIIVGEASMILVKN